MNPVTHLLISWLFAEIPRSLSRKDKAAIIVVGVLPDIDGIGAIAEHFTRDKADPLLWFAQYHHMLHNVSFGLEVAAIASLFARRRLLVGSLGFLAFNVHIVCDVIGSRGPDGYQWPILYLFPFSRTPELTWYGQWPLNSWPNFAITLLTILAALWLARERGYSVVMLFSQKADAAIVETIRRRFPTKQKNERRV
jgi:inner membrane protein